MSMTSNYANRGVSSSKEDVHNAISKLDKGLHKKSFCKVFPDYLSLSNNHRLVCHSDGSGTKSILAYLYWKKTGDLSVWKGIAQDALVMNTDDLLCVGVSKNFCFTSTIGRNKNLISGEVISSIINGTSEIISEFKKMGINIYYMGGETADVGDIVRTIIVDGSITSRIHKKDIIDNSKIKSGNVIIGFSSSGQSTYENQYNSGIGSNGLTSARHELLNKSYEINFPESFDSKVPSDFRFCGKYDLTDTDPETGITIGKLLLSPTRTYLPIVNEIFKKIGRENINGIIHCSGGGQTKILNFIDNLHIIKDNLFEIPPIFKLIKKESDTNPREMYEVFNMGHRLEMYVDIDFAENIIDISKEFNVEAKIIGRVEESSEKKLTLSTVYGNISY
jgi:phosphoribosylformylglycinamidine cyclo-ligase